MSSAFTDPLRNSVRWRWATLLHWKSPAGANQLMHLNQSMLCSWNTWIRFQTPLHLEAAHLARKVTESRKESRCWEENQTKNQHHKPTRTRQSLVRLSQKELPLNFIAQQRQNHKILMFKLIKKKKTYKLLCRTFILRKFMFSGSALNFQWSQQSVCIQKE